MSLMPHDGWKGSFGHALGLSYEPAEPGQAVATLKIKKEQCNPSGVCHGGAMFSLADDVMGAALHPLCPEGMVPAATQANIHFSRSARQGDLLRAEGKVLSRGKRTGLLEARVTDDQGRLVALVTASYLFVEARYKEVLTD
jgi:uncharacterized protein (TIGR00369 family)